MTEQKVMGKTPDGEDIVSITYENESTGEGFSVMNYGAALLSLKVSASAAGDKGAIRDVVLGFENIKDYFGNHECFGVVVGPNANRVKGATFQMNGQKYTMAKNDGENNNHSGMTGWNKRLWKIDDITEDEDVCSVTMIIESPAGECGLPGDMTAYVTYTFKDGALGIDYEAQAYSDTVFNPTNHSYFNLEGHAAGSIEDHFLCISADEILVAGADSVPMGERRKVIGTPFDFTKKRRIGERISEDYDELVFGKGYDHCFVLNKNTVSDKFDFEEEKLYCTATLFAPDNSLCMDVFTDAPGMMVYTGNYLGGEKGKGGVSYVHRGGIALETQYFPNALNVDDFEKPFVEKAMRAHTKTVFAFRRD